MTYIILSLFFFALVAHTECDFKSFQDAEVQGHITGKVDNGHNLGPTRDQDSVGWCYAYAGADMVEQWLKRKNSMPKDQNVSAVSMAIRNNGSSFLEYSGQQHIESLKLHTDDVPGWIQNRIKFLESEIDKIDVERVITKDTAIIEKDFDLKEELFYYKELSKKSLFFGNDFPSGGYSDLVISSSWPHICFESEISSRDHFVVERLLEQKSLKEVFESIFKYRFDTDIDFDFDISSCEECNAYVYANEVFPGIGNIEIIFDIVQKMDPYDDLLAEFVNEACVSKGYTSVDEPVFSSESIDQDNLANEGANDYLFDNIDKALESGQISSVYYNATVFESENDALINNKMNRKNHASVIIGSSQICGEKYYTLRNSWGAAGCENFQSKVLAERKDDALIKKHEEMFISCASAAGIKDRVNVSCDWIFAEEGSVKTEEELVASCNGCKQQFYENIKMRPSKKDLPYLCDGKGNFIVKKEHFKKGLFGEVHITN